MKKITTLLLFLSIHLIFSQNSKIEYENFKLQANKELVWQKVYDIKGSKDSINKHLKDFITTNSFLNKLKYDNYGYTGFSNYTKISDLNGVTISAHTDFNCFISIEIKENEYRISISNVKFKPLPKDFNKTGNNTDVILEDITVRNKFHEIRNKIRELRNRKSARKTLLQLNLHFIKILTL